MIAKTFLGTLLVRQSGFDASVRYLLVANSKSAAEKLLETQAREHFCDPSDEEDDEAGVFQDKHGFWVYAATDSKAMAQSVTPLGVATYLELRPLLPVRKTANVQAPTEANLQETVQAAACAVEAGLAAKGHEVPHSVMLHAMASALGAANWHAHQARANLANPGFVAQLKEAVQKVVDYADDEGCQDDLTVTSASAIVELNELVTANL